MHMKVTGGRTNEGLESKGIANLFSRMPWMTWTPCTLWAPISLSVKLGLGPMKAKPFSTSHSLGLAGSPPTLAFGDLLSPLFLFLVPDMPCLPNCTTVVLPLECVVKSLGPQLTHRSLGTGGDAGQEPQEFPSGILTQGPELWDGFENSHLWQN